ncbi:hypothetical protein FRC08_012998, partial [Ceratobasidium sp. 394]
MVATITGVWQLKGWQCVCMPVRLQSLEPTTIIDAPGVWKPGEYSVMVIYVTHGTSGEKRFQVADRRELSPAEFLNVTLKGANHLLRPAKSTCGFMLTCGHVYDIPDNVIQIQDWMDRTGMLHHLAGTLNTRLCPAYMVNMMAQASVELLG